MKEEKKNTENNLIFGRYKIIKKIDEGSFGKVYLGLNIKNKEKVALKLEPKSNPLYFLETEAYYLYILKGIGIPKFETFGHNEKYNILVETLLGKSLQYLFFKYNKYFSLKDVLMIGIQIIERLKFIHSKNIIHRDIKPENFLIGYNDPYLIYLIDFGLAKKYRSSRTGKHVQFSIPKRITGTARYSSLNALKGYQVSRRDDLECAAYVLIYFLRGDLPWEKIEAKRKADKYRKIYKLKSEITPEKLCENLPNEICEYLKYTRNLDFEQEPNYEYCCSLFNNVLIKIGAQNDLIFTWINKTSILNKLKKKNNSINYLGNNNNTNCFRIFDITKRKSSPQTRIYHTLQNSFEKNRFNSFTNMNNTINTINTSIGDNYISSDKNNSIDSNFQKNNYFNQTLKIKNNNSLLNNESYNIQNKNEQRKNTTFKTLNNLNNIKQDNSIKNKNNIINYLNNYNLQSHSENKYNNYKNNEFFQKINNQKVEANFLRNNNNNILGFNSNIRQNNLKIVNPVYKDYEMNSKKIKLINIERNVLNIKNKNDISNNINNTFIEKINNKNNMKEKNIIKITNIYKTKINGKKNYYNIIQNNNRDINQILMPSKNNKQNHIKIIKNVFKVTKDNNLTIRNNNYNELQNNKQLLLKKSNLISPNNNVIKKDKNLINLNIKNKMNSLNNKKRNINQFINNDNDIKNNNLTLNENRIKKKISNSFEEMYYNDIINISNEGENHLFNIEKTYNKNKKEKLIFNNKNNINKTNENQEDLEKKKKIQINSLNINKKKLMSIKLKLNQISNNNKKNSNYLKSNDILYNIQPNSQKNNHYNSFNIIQPLNNSSIKNIITNNNSNLKYLPKVNHLKSEINHSSSRLTDIPLNNELNLNNIYNYNNLGEINDNQNKSIPISNKVKKSKITLSNIIKNGKLKNQPFNSRNKNNILNTKQLEQYHTINF